MIIRPYLRVEKLKYPMLRGLDGDDEAPQAFKRWTKVTPRLAEDPPVDAITLAVVDVTAVRFAFAVLACFHGLQVRADTLQETVPSHFVCAEAEKVDHHDFARSRL